jgi:hypothetical protein
MGWMAVSRHPALLCCSDTFFCVWNMIDASEFDRRYQDLKDHGRTVVDEVRKVLPELISAGQPIPKPLERLMAAHKNSYIDLCHFAWPNRSAPVGKPTYEHFNQRQAELAQPLSSPNVAVSDDPLEWVASLQAAGGASSLLDAIRSKVRQIQEGRDEAEIASAKNLLLLVAGADGVSDEQWQVLFDSVASTFGREVALAATRGRLMLS